MNEQNVVKMPPRRKKRGSNTLTKSINLKERKGMSKQLRFTYEGKDYVLEFTRRTVEQMERNGFIASDVRDKPMTTLPALFAGAFLANHRFVRQDLVDSIYAKMPNKQELIGKLAEMYNEPITALVDEPEDDVGNVDWTANW